MRGERLTKLRQEKHMSQRELGELVAVSGYTISAYELDRSDPSDDIKIRLAEFFDVSVDYLIGLIDQPLSYRRDANVVMLPRNFTEVQKAQLKTFLQTLDQDWAGSPPKQEEQEQREQQKQPPDPLEQPVGAIGISGQHPSGG